MRWPWSKERRKLERARRELDAAKQRTPEVEKRAQRAESRIRENQFAARFTAALGGDGR